jgi:choline dehydrogenase-like flavoprotein
VATFAGVLDRALRGAGLGAIDRDGLDDAGAFGARVRPAFHHCGATRMHPDPASGVLDPDGRVHGLPHVWVASTSAFPTSGFSNPTLTMLALALRLADRLGREL